MTEGEGGDQLIKAVAGQHVEDELGDAIRAAEKSLYGELTFIRRAVAALEKVGASTGTMIGDSVYDCIAAGRAGLPSLTGSGAGSWGNS